MLRSLALLLAAAAAAPAAEINWTKTVLDTKFRSEGVAVADVNKDGKPDVMVGELWYEAPTWTAHEMQKPGDYKDGAAGYSQVFACWADDFNADGYPDLLVVGFPGQPAYWLENPKGDPKSHWAKHEVWHSACNETPLYTDQLVPGKRVLVMGTQPKGKEREGRMAYFTPHPGDPNALWDMHTISEPSVAPEMKDGKPVPKTGKETPGTFKYAHGLGVGDVNGDGRADVMTPGGWWEQPTQRDEKAAWAFHPWAVNDPCADMVVYDLDGTGKAAVISSSAHNYGIWAYRQRGDAFQKVELFPKLVSQTHALHCVDINGDGLKDLVTGKRWWAHGPKGDADPMAPAKLYWFEAKKGPDGEVGFTPHEIDGDSGIGTQFVVADVNGDGLSDVVTSNKKGVRVIVQGRK